MFLLLFVEVEVSFSLKDIAASAADPRQAEVNGEMHKKPEGVSYRQLRAGLSAIAMVVIATIITACGNSQAEAPPPAARGRCRPGRDQIRAPVGRIYRAGRGHRCG